MAIVLVHTIGNTSTFASTSLAWGANTTTGNLIIVACGNTGSINNVTSVTDSQSNTYTQVFSSSPTGSDDFEFWYAKNITGGTTPTITIAYSSSSSFNTAVAREYSGLDTSSPLDVNNGAAIDIFQATCTSNSVTTTSANELIVGACMTNSSVTFGAGTGYGNLTSQTNVAAIALEDQIVSSTGTYTASFTGTAGATAGIGIITFKAVSSGALTVSVSDTTTTSETVKLLDTLSINKSDTMTTSESATVSTSLADLGINVSPFNSAYLIQGVKIV